LQLNLASDQDKNLVSGRRSAKQCLFIKRIESGETAATAGTSGVIYSVTDKNASDAKSRVNTFIHVNNSAKAISNGCVALH